MKRRPVLLAIFATIASCDAFAAIRPRAPSGAASSETRRAAASASASAADRSTRSRFLETLERPYDLNKRSEERKRCLKDVLDGEGSLANPGSRESFAKVAPGVWRVVYAPHMTIMAGLFQGELSVQYDLEEDGTIISHAKYNFPLFNLYGYLSVSGTYGSVNDKVCRVDFDEAWIRTFDDDSFEEGPYPDIASVPDSLSKTLIRNVGRALFIEPFAVFPVSYLDDELIVFDFELLGTRICARKES